MLRTIHAHRWGWQGGTGWHANRHPRATPCFTGFSSLQLRQSQSLLRRSNLATLYARAYFCANRCIRGLSRALACKQGVATRMNACHPHILLTIVPLLSGFDRDSGDQRCLRAEIMTGAAPTADGPAHNSPIKPGVARGVSPACHPVPPCHPPRHALLDKGRDLRVMTEARERFTDGE